MNQLSLNLQVSDVVLEQLQITASERGLLVDDIVSELLEDYYDNPGDEEILEGIREGILDALAGRTRPARAALAELNQAAANDAHQG